MKNIGVPQSPRGRLLLLAASIALSGCDRSEEFSAPERTTAPIARAFVGATIVDGTGGPVILNGVVLVGADGRIAETGRTAEVQIPEGAERIDVAGRFIVPGLVNTHGHVGDTRGLEAGHYSRENVLDQLGLYSRYGVTTVLSLGGDGPEGVEVRDAQTSPTLDRARLFVAGDVVTGDTPEAARQMVDANAALGVDFIKIRVDDNLGTTEKMPPEVYGAVIRRAHELGLPVAAHVFYLDDAKALLEAGVDVIAHSVRDREVDGSFAAALIGNDVCYTPTLAREVTTFIYGSTPAFFEDPFFLAEADSAVLEELSDPERQQRIRDSPAAQAYQRALVQAESNLGILSEAGVRIAMGTDTGPPGRFQGFYEHIELALMAEAGMTPDRILVAATSDAARCIGREDVGTVEPGKWADLLVLQADPLADARNLRLIESVWIAGNRVPGR